MKFTEEHKSLSETVKNFAQNEIVPFIEDWEKNGAFPAHQLFKKINNNKLEELNINNNDIT